VLLFLLYAHAQIVCNVGAGGGNTTFSSIQAGLLACNNSIGSVRLLIQPGIYNEPGLFFPIGLTEVYLTASNFASVPLAPFANQVNVTILGNNFIVASPTTSLFFEGIGIDGQEQDSPLFVTPLINNNFTASNSHIVNFFGDYAVRAQPCARDVVVSSLGSRWENIHGSAIEYKGLESVQILDSIFDKVGGLNNHSSVVLKPSYVSTGQFVVTNSSIFLTADLQPKRCRFTPDQNGMIRCNNNTLQCYDQFTTQLIQGNRCPKQQIPYRSETSNTTGVALDFPVSCRIYVPCVCQDILFQNGTSGQFTLPIGDM